MNKDFKRAMLLTKVILSPEQKIFTFWQTNFKYFIISSNGETCSLRRGKLICDKPQIIMPDSMSDNFHGFQSKASEFASEQFNSLYSKLKMLGYQFKNTLKSKEILNISEKQLIENIKIEQKKEIGEIAIITVPEDIWDLSLLKIALEVVKKSASTNMQDLQERGYFQTEKEKDQVEIECLFEEANENPFYVNELGDKLQTSGLFDEYEDRFYKLIKTKS